MKRIIIVALMLISVIGYSKISERDMMSLQELDKQTFKKDMKKIHKELINQKSEIVPTMMRAICSEFDKYNKHPFVDSDLGYEKKWFNSLKKLLVNMSKVKKTQKLAKTTRNIEVYKKSASLYAKDLKTFDRILSKPQKVDKTRLKSLRKEARRKRRELEKRLDSEVERDNKTINKSSQ